MLTDIIAKIVIFSLLIFIGAAMVGIFLMGVYAWMKDINKMIRRNERRE